MLWARLANPTPQLPVDVTLQLLKLKPSFKFDKKSRRFIWSNRLPLEIRSPRYNSLTPWWFLFEVCALWRRNENGCLQSILSSRTILWQLLDTMVLQQPRGVQYPILIPLGVPATWEAAILLVSDFHNERSRAERSPSETEPTVQSPAPEFSGSSVTHRWLRSRRTLGSRLLYSSECSESLGITQSTRKKGKEFEYCWRNLTKSPTLLAEAKRETPLHGPGSWTGSLS